MTSVPNPFHLSDEEIARRKAKHYARYAQDRADEARFFKDVADHKMYILKDDGVYRHVRFKQPDSMNMHFDLITYPGGMLYTGDMGTFVFWRLEDMFEFFRSSGDRDWMKEVGVTLYTNHSYWSEKLIASNCSGRFEGKSTEFNAERFKEVIIEDYLRRWIRTSREEGTLDKDERRELWEEVHSEIIDRCDDYGENIQTKAYEFNWKPSRGYGEKAPSFHFDDLFEHNFQQYTHSFRWACLAIAWGILKYDTLKDEQKKAAAKKDAFDSLPDDFEVN